MQERLTREEALEMQEALIAEYGKPEFQAKLRVVLKDTTSTEERVKLDQELREVRQKVGARFGFEASPEGVAKSAAMFTPVLLADPQIASNCNVINILLFPQLQNEVNEKKNVMIPRKMVQFLKSRAEMAAKYDAEMATRKKAFKKKYMVEEVGRLWTVICEKGVLVREGEELHSQELPLRLASTSIIEELELVGVRLHYKKLVGEGPDSGWVSVMIRGSTLLSPLQEDKPTELPKPEIV